MKRELVEQLARITEEERRILQGRQVDLTLYNAAGAPVMEPERIISGGARFGIRPHTRFVDFPRHSHSYVEMVYQVRGGTRHIINGRAPLTLREGHLLLLGRGAVHEVLAAGEQDLAVNFILIPGFFDSAAISLGSSNALAVFLRDNLAGRRQAAGYLLFDVSGSLLAENLLENLIHGELSGVGTDIQQMTLELLLRNLSAMSGRLVTETRKEREQAVVLDVLSRIERQTQLNLSEVAQMMGLDVTVLSRMIKRQTGCTFTELLHTARFNRAVGLLRDTDLSVAEIAAAIGYENTAFFYRRFARQYGCTPGEYRKRGRA